MVVAVAVYNCGVAVYKFVVVAVYKCVVVVAVYKCGVAVYTAGVAVYKFVVFVAVYKCVLAVYKCVCRRVRKCPFAV